MLRPTLPASEFALVVRSDFEDDLAWQAVCAEIQAPQTNENFTASVECVSDPQCSDLSQDEICSLIPDAEERSFVFVVDARTMSSPEHAVLVVKTADSRRSFRVLPREAWAVENNLNLANMDFEEFEDAVDSDGVFRGFAD